MGDRVCLFRRGSRIDSHPDSRLHITRDAYTRTINRLAYAMAAVARITENTPDSELRRLMRHGVPFRNSRGTFLGIKMTPDDVAQVTEHPEVISVLTNAALLALTLDAPDYMVWSGKAPLAWRSTTRGIDHRKDQSHWKWVTSQLRVWPDYPTQRRFNRMVGIVNALNREETK